MLRAIESTYWFGDVVYLRVADEPIRGMVTGVNIRPSGHVYQITWPNRCDSFHYDCELSTEYVPDFASN